MIRTGEVSQGRFIITDDVNSQNVELVRNWYTKADIYIDKRFDIPMSDYTQQNISQSKVGEYIDYNLKEITEAVKSGKPAIVTGETQLKSLTYKINFWATQQFSYIIDKMNKDEQVKILIDNSVSKHEFLFLGWLNDLGAEILIISKDTNKLGKLSDSIQLNIFNTNEKLEYRAEVLQSIRTVADTKGIKTINDIELALYENNSIIKLNLDGIGNYIDTCDFYGKLHNMSETSDDFKLVINRFDNPSPKEISEIPRFKKEEHKYVLETLLMFLNIEDKGIEVKLKEAMKTEFNSPENISLIGGIFYNKLAYNIIILRGILNSKVKHLVYYGTIYKNDISILRILSRLDVISVLVLTPNKTGEQHKLWDLLPRLELESSIEDLEMPVVDSRDNARTAAAVATRITNETLYSGDVLGLYKPGQFITCETMLFSTAYEEIGLWWNKEMYLRPKFKASGIKSVLPTMLKVIRGVPDNIIQTPQLYLNIIQEYLWGNTILCKDVNEIENLLSHKMQIVRATDMNGTNFADQKPFIVKGKLDKQRIKQCINYSYGFLSTQKQDFILNKIEEVINSEYLVYRDKNAFIDLVLNTLLSLGDTLVQKIQWFEFYTDNPNFVLVMPNQTMLKLEHAILTLFMHLIGFDILIFVPTCYKSLEELFTSKIQYETHNIGYANYNIDTQNLFVSKYAPVKNNQAVGGAESKKKSLISKILGF